MSQQELLKKVVAALESGAIPYMLTGSLVSSLRGEPRSTHDIDDVVAMQHSEAGGSEKQVGDALRVYELQPPELDGPYLREWAVRLGVADLLDRIEHEAVSG
jgi:hypothetical protein